jgi:gliding motility-associated-like protein
VARNAGRYSVIGTTAEGCRSYDTVYVNSVYPNPVVNLNKDTAICSGSVKLLDAGSGFADYAWSNGSNTRSIIANSQGLYWVTVTDNNGCKGSDTSRITSLWPAPKDFLPSDTAICTYGNLLLKPSGSFDRYLWSNNSITSSITVSKEGKYYLTVTDKNNCSGTDTVNVGRKDCLTGFFAPNAFTPDGKKANNNFKPLIFGNVVKYSFNIYNRWGQTVFHSTEPGRGWDGTIGGKPQDSNVFVWVCTYQFSGEPVKIEKGSVVLVR